MNHKNPGINLVHSTKLEPWLTLVNVNSIVLDKNHIDQDITFSNVPSN